MGLVQSATKFGVEKIFDKLYEDPAHQYYPYVRRIFKDIDPHVGKIFLSNFFVNAGLYRHHRERIQRSSKDNASKKRNADIETDATENARPTGKRKNGPSTKSP